MIEGDGNKVGLEKRLERLEAIIDRMESEDVALDEALQLFEEGVGHVREAEQVLAEAELRVEELLAGGEMLEREIVED